MASSAPQSPEFGFAFVAENGLERPNKAMDRKLIRSRCMRGKNRKIGLARAVVRREQLPVRHEGSLTGATESSSRGGPAVLAHHPRRKAKARALVADRQDLEDETEDQETDQTLQLAETGPTSLTSQVSPSILTAIQMAFEVPVKAKVQVFDYLEFLYESTDPIRRFVDCDIYQSKWGLWVFSEPAFLQSCIFMSMAKEDIIHERPISPKTLHNLQKTIALVKKSLASPDSRISVGDASVAVVAVLALVSCAIGDRDSAKAHIKGLEQMMRVRRRLHTPANLVQIGAVHGPTRSPDGPVRTSFSAAWGPLPSDLCARETIEACFLVDLIYAVCTGAQNGLLTAYAAAYIPHICTLGVPARSGVCVDPTVFAPAADPRVLSIFREFQFYAVTMNSVGGAQPRRSQYEYLKVHGSLQSQLFALQGQFKIDDKRDGGVSECLRLALLTVLVTLFRFPGVKPGYGYLTSRFRECCQRMKVGNHMPSRNLMRWLLITGANTVFDVSSMDEQWMWERWRDDVDPLDWKGTKARLKEIMWMDALPDSIGLHAYRLLNKYQGLVPA